MKSRKLQLLFEPITITYDGQNFSKNSISLPRYMDGRLIFILNGIFSELKRLDFCEKQLS